jgi:hypothetical protein
MSFGRVAVSAAGSAGLAAPRALTLAVGGPALNAQPASTRSSVPGTLQPAPPARTQAAGPPSGSGGGNIAVEVPPVPPHAVIVHLCRDLTSGRKAEPAAWLPDLITITGGTQAATTSWCRTFLTTAGSQ